MDALIRDLARATIGGTFNQYSDEGPDDLPGAAEKRRENLRHYLALRRRAGVLAVGEAGGYQGMRWSGIAFTSERDLASWGAPFAATCAARRWSEPSGTIVHRVLGELGAELQVVLWNTVPTHPHRAGEPLSNRRPKPAEIAAGAVFLERAIEILRPPVVIAVGRVAESVLGDRATYVRHPANGGGAAFAEGLRAILECR
jgi:uracil-DNA glycosylase